MFMRLSTIHPGRMAAAIVALGSSMSAAASEAIGAPTMPPVIDTGDVLNVVTNLAFIIVAVVVMAWLYRRAQRMQNGNADIIHILATQTVGPKERVLLVEVAGQQLVLGLTASQIRTLHVLDQPLIQEQPQTPATGFAERLRTAMKGSRA